MPALLKIILIGVGKTVAIILLEEALRTAFPKE